MDFSRRSFVRALGWTGLGTVAATLRPAGVDALTRTAAQGAPPIAPSIAAPRSPASALGSFIKIDSNENPYGVGPSVAEAVQQALALAGRYPRNRDTLTDALARLHGVPPPSILLGCGSGELLRAATLAFTSRTRAAVVPSPTFETCGETASRLGYPVREVRVDASLRLDLDAMRQAAAGAGLVYICNPNNPTGTVRSARDIEQFIEYVLGATPDAAVLVDEAYHEFVDDPSYATAIPLAIRSPRVIVTRTFSKIYGMAGLRVGYAIGHPDALAAMEQHMPFGTMSVLSVAAALAALHDTKRLTEQQQANRETRLAMRKLFEDAGYRVAASDANFLMVDVRQRASDFRGACRAHGVLVGRPFPPLDTHARITIGTKDEMQRAADAFRRVLGIASAAAAPAAAA